MGEPGEESWNYVLMYNHGAVCLFLAIQIGVAGKNGRRHDPVGMTVAGNEATSK